MSCNLNDSINISVIMAHIQTTHDLENVLDYYPARLVTIKGTRCYFLFDAEYITFEEYLEILFEHRHPYLEHVLFELSEYKKRKTKNNKKL